MDVNRRCLKGTLVVDDYENDVFSKLLAAMGPCLEDLALEWGVLTKSINAFPSSLCNLRRLRIFAEFTDIHVQEVLSACSRTLKSLHVDGHWLHKHLVDAIAAHCAGLEELSLRHGGSETLLDMMWRALGPTLRRLSLWRLVIDDATYTRGMVDLTGGIAESAKI